MARAEIKLSFLYSYEEEFIQSLLSTGKKMLASQFNLKNRYIDDVFQSITQLLIIIWVRCIPLSSESKPRKRATTLYPKWTCSCRSGGTASCTFPLTTNVTISTSISQTFRSWVAIFHLRQLMVFYLTAHTVCQGLLLLWMRHDFHLSSSDRDILGNVWNRPSVSCMVDIGIALNIMKSPSPKCYVTFWTIYSDTFNWSDITPIC